MKQLPGGPYNFKETEGKILKFWQSKPFFKPEFDPKTGEVQSLEEFKSDPREKWTLICPPPNAYDRPHMGNLSGYSYMDAMARYNRLQNKRVIMLPGKDHAGLEGEATFIRDVLEKEGKKKSDFSREEFYQRVWDHQQKFVKSIRDDEMIVGLSADFDRDLYTLDDRIVNTVLGTFVDMYQKGLLYKGVRIVNWDVKAQSTIPDNQCIREEREGKLYFIKYPIVKSRAWKLNFRIPEVLEAIRSGKKTVETRALNPEEPERYFGDIKEGDIIVCVDKTNGRDLIKKVAKVKLAQSWQEAWENFEWDKIYSRKSAAKSLEELKEDWAELEASYVEKIEKNGMVSIDLIDLEEDDYLMTATTRPETMLGDTALVVHPTDERYAHLIGKKVIIPLANREIPIITNGRIEKEFGTGVLKCTPAHAAEDWEIRQEWNSNASEDKKIGYINVIDKNLRLVGPIPEKYKGLKVNAAREAVIVDLREAGLIEKEETLIQNVLVSERTGVIVEPLMTSQWFMNVDGFKKPLREMVENGDTKIHPKNLEKRYFAWLDNMRDWAISRNLWWGYRLPVWYSSAVQEEIDPEGQVKLKIKNEKLKIEEDFNPTNPDHMRVQIENPGEGWIQDNDILDTWFSSGQWPYAVLETFDLMDIAYPTDVLVSATDLLVKWDLTMMLFSSYKTGKAPFKNLFLTGLVKGIDGQKMSKSKRNFVPLDETRELYGVDSFRMNCFYQNKAGRSYAITPATLKNFRNFNNKLWNASKFVMMNLEGMQEQSWFAELDKVETSEHLLQFVTLRQAQGDKFKLEQDDISMIDKMIELEKSFHANMEKFRFGKATEDLYNHFWHEYCDFYIEATKSRVWKDKESGEYKSSEASRIAAQATLYYSLKSYLKMLHPFIPFVTEEIWQHLVEDGKYEMAMMYRS